MDQIEIDNIVNLGPFNGITPRMFQKLYGYWYTNSHHFSRPQHRGGVLAIVEEISRSCPDRRCRCMDYGYGKCSTDDCLMRYNDIACSAICGKTCKNQFPTKDSNRFRVAPIEHKGRGLLALSPYNVGDFMMEITGTFRHVDEMTPERFHYSIMIFDFDYFLEFRQAGNYSRHINHSCNSNAEVRIQVVDGMLRMGVFATKIVHPNDEITRDYGENLDFLCFCKSRQCRKSGFTKKLASSKLPRLLPNQGQQLYGATQLNPLQLNPNAIGVTATSTPRAPGKGFFNEAIDVSPIASNTGLQQPSINSNQTYQVPQPPKKSLLDRARKDSTGLPNPNSLSQQLASIPEEPEGLAPPPRPMIKPLCDCKFYLTAEGFITRDISRPECPLHRFKPFNVPLQYPPASAVTDSQEGQPDQQPARNLNKYGTSDDESTAGPDSRKGTWADDSIDPGNERDGGLNQYGTSDDDSSSPCKNPNHPLCIAKLQEQRKKYLPGDRSGSSSPEGHAPPSAGQPLSTIQEEEQDETLLQENALPPPPASRGPNKSMQADKTLTGSPLEKSTASKPRGPSKQQPATNSQISSLNATRTPSNESTTATKPKKPAKGSKNDPSTFPESASSRTRIPRTSKTAAIEKMGAGNSKRPPKQEPRPRSKRDRTQKQTDKSNAESDSPSPDSKRETKKTKMDEAIEKLDAGIEALKEASKERSVSRTAPGNASAEGDAPAYPMDDGQRPGTSRPRRSTLNPNPRYNFQTDSDFTAQQQQQTCTKSKGNKKSQDSKSRSQKEAVEEYEKVPLKVRLTERLAQKCGNEANQKFYDPPVRPDPLPREPGQRGGPRLHSPGHIFSCNGEDGCDYFNTHRGTFNRHRKFVHSKEKPFVCPYVLIDECKAEPFKLNQCLTRHLKRVHKDKYAYVCKFRCCGRRFKTAEDRHPHHRVCPRNPKNLPKRDEEEDAEDSGQCEESDQASNEVDEPTGDACDSDDQSDDNDDSQDSDALIICGYEGCEMVFASEEERRLHETLECDYNENNSVEPPPMFRHDEDAEDDPCD